MEANVLASDLECRHWMEQFDKDDLFHLRLGCDAGSLDFVVNVRGRLANGDAYCWVNCCVCGIACGDWWLPLYAAWHHSRLCKGKHFSEPVAMYGRQVIGDEQALALL